VKIVVVINVSDARMRSVPDEDFSRMTSDVVFRGELFGDINR
jgi:hypothetical protein